MMLSKSGDRLTFLDGPADLTIALGTALREYFPRRITTDRATEDGLHIFEIKRGPTGGMSRFRRISIRIKFLHFPQFW